MSWLNFYVGFSTSNIGKCTVVTMQRSVLNVVGHIKSESDCVAIRTNLDEKKGGKQYGPKHSRYYEFNLWSFIYLLSIMDGG